jgi:Carboxypeptidase regulatory-like domain
MSRAVIAFCILLASPGFAVQNTVIEGKVTDCEGAALANARILIHWDSSGSSTGLKDNIGTKHDVAGVSDREGKYSVHVPPGFYDIFVSAKAFTPTAAKVRVKPDQPSTFDAALCPDPLVSKELAHYLYTSLDQGFDVNAAPIARHRARLVIAFPSFPPKRRLSWR